MSAFGGKADVIQGVAECPLLAISGHSGDGKKRAVEWLDKMSSTLGKSPRELLSDRAGLDRVLRHIRSVELALDTD